MECKPSITKIYPMRSTCFELCHIDFFSGKRGSLQYMENMKETSLEICVKNDYLQGGSRVK